MEHIPESGRTTPSAVSDKLNRSPTKAPLASSGSLYLSASTRKMPQSSSRSLMTTPPPPSRSGGRATPPVQLLEMSVTEQIARKARKSTVLNDKNALLILAIPDYDDYKILQPYSCRSLSNKSKFVGGKDFITRHNPQEVSEFKKQYSRDVGNLNRHRSILAPPTTAGASQLLSNGGSLSGSSSLAFFASQALSSPSKMSSNTSITNSSGPEIWRQAFTADQKPCWVLTDFGIESLIGPEYRITTRMPMLPALSPHSSSNRMESSATAPSIVPSLRSPLRPETALALASFTKRESARLGSGVNLLDEKQLASLSRIAAYSPKSRPPSPLRSPYRAGPTGATLSGSLTERSPSKVHQFAHTFPVNRPSTDPAMSPSHRAHLEGHLAETPNLSPSKDNSNPHLSLSSASPTATDRHCHTQTAASPTAHPFAMEISPPRVTLGTLRRNEVYLFPIRVRNVGFKQERFRVKHVGASCAGFEAAIAEVSYDKESARLAPGLAAILTLTLCFQHPGKIFGRVQVETEGVGSCEVEIRGAVR